MILSKEQKEFLNKINLQIDSKDRLKDINTFFNTFCKIKERLKSCPAVTIAHNLDGINTVSSEIYKIKGENVDARITLVNKSIIFLDEERVYYDTLYFLELMDFLEQNKLITFTDKAPDDIEKLDVPVLEKTFKYLGNDIHPIDDRLWQLIKEFVLVEIVPLPKLDEFIKRGYKTDQEHYTEEENKDRKRANRNTLVIAIITVVLSSLINYLIYTNKRDVNVINQRDTINVKVLPNQNIDTIKSIISDSIKNLKDRIR
jgi:hypothetical protein